jgi:hypothetical protein
MSCRGSWLNFNRIIFCSQIGPRVPTGNDLQYVCTGEKLPQRVMEHGEKCRSEDFHDEELAAAKHAM